MDFSLTLLRISQIREHIAANYPQAERDTHLNGLLRSLGDEVEDLAIIEIDRGA